MSRRRAVAVAAGVALAALASSTAHAAPVVTRAAGAGPAALQPAVDGFRAQLGPLNPNAAGSAPDGRREIHWDAVPDGLASPRTLPYDYYNVNSPRGVQLRGPDGAPATARVSASAASGNAELRDLDPGYPALFQPFSPERLFAPATRPLDVVFRTPGGLAGATTDAFGAVFTGVGTPTSTFLQFYDQNGADLGAYFAPPGSLSFVGVRFDAGERVALVRIQPGDAALGPGVLDRGGVDVVAMDDVVYGEPQPIAPAGESFEGGLGGFAASVLAGNPGDATWTQSGSDQRGGSRAAFVPDPNHVTDMALTSAPVAIRGGGPTTLEFFQRIASERRYDGGVVEISADDGASWTRAEQGQYLVNPPTVAVSRAFRSPLLDPAAERYVFTGNSNGFERTVLDLTPFAGRTIRYRFRFGTDISVSRRGWWIDDVSVNEPAVLPPAEEPRPDAGPPAVKPGAARITRLAVVPRRFRSGQRAIRVRYRLTAASRVRFTVLRSVRGRRARGRCRPAARRGRRCVRRTAVGAFRARGRAGANRRAFPRRLRGRRLRPGRYVLRARAGRSRRAAAFRVTRRPRRR